MDTTSPSAPPQLSPDGLWWWDGQQWVPAPPPTAPVAPPPDAPAAQPVWPSFPTPATTPAGPAYGYQPPRPTDGLAIASLVLSLVWMLGLGSICAVVLGHVSRGRAKREGREKSGVALAGLIIGYLGVVSLVGILAAIAIPTFLDQRSKAFDATLKADLREAALVQEAAHIDYDAYVDLDTLQAAGFAPADGVQVDVLEYSASSYCMVATTADVVWYFGSADSAPTTTPCA